MPETRNLIARGFTVVEGVVYIGLALLLTAVVLTLLVVGVIEVAQSIASAAPAPNVIALLDRILLVLLIVGEQHEGAAVATGPLVLELAVLAGPILALAVALWMLRRRGGDGPVAERG